ncbi:MAG: tetratricopeptide repeat protein [bacterium]
MKKVAIILLSLFYLQVTYTDDGTVNKVDWNIIKKSIAESKITVNELIKILEEANKDGDYENIYTLSNIILSNESYKDNPYILNELGTCAFYTRHISDAYQWFSKAIEIKQDFVEANANIGVLMRIKGRYDEALNYLLSVLDALPLSSIIHYNIAICYERLGKPYEEERYLRKAIELDSKFVVAYKKLAVLALSQNRNDEALNILRVYSGLVKGKDEDALSLIKQLTK